MTVPILFKFTEAKLNTPYDNLAAALGIVQNQILAADTNFDTKVIFGPNVDFTKTVPLETVVALLVPILDALEGVRWEVPAQEVAP